MERRSGPRSKGRTPSCAVFRQTPRAGGGGSGRAQAAHEQHDGQPARLARRGESPADAVGHHANLLRRGGKTRRHTLGLGAGNRDDRVGAPDRAGHDEAVVVAEGPAVTSGDFQEGQRMDRDHQARPPRDMERRHVGGAEEDIVAAGQPRQDQMFPALPAVSRGRARFGDVKGQGHFPRRAEEFAGIALDARDLAVFSTRPSIKTVVFSEPFMPGALSLRIARLRREPAPAGSGMTGN